MPHYLFCFIATSRAVHNLSLQARQHIAFYSTVAGPTVCGDPIQWRGSAAWNECYNTYDCGSPYMAHSHDVTVSLTSAQLIAFASPFRFILGNEI